MATWCTEALRERKRLRVVRSGTLYFLFVEYQINKVPMDVVAFLVVNHIKYQCIVFVMLCLCLSLW